MTRTGVRRALAPSERVHAAKDAFIGYTVHATGRLDEDALGAAYRTVCRAYPQLSARVEAGEGGFAVLESDASPVIRFADGDPDRPLSGLELDQRRALSALGVVRDGDRASVCLALQHSVADAYHAIDVLAALWSCYTDIVHGLSPELPRRPFPRSLEDLLGERGIHPVADTGTEEPAPPPAPGPPAALPEPVVRHVLQHRLSTAETAALVELGHRERVTINGLLSGAILLVEAELRDLPVTDLVLRYAANLRSRLDPPVGPAEGTNVLGGVAFTVPGDLEPTAVAIGRAIGAQLQAGLADGSVQRSLLDMLSGPAARAPKPWDPSMARKLVSVMNWGVVPSLRTPEGLRLTNFHSASRMREAVSLGGYVVNTFDGRIGIDLAWPLEDPQLPRRLEGLRAGLSALTGGR